MRKTPLAAVPILTHLPHMVEEFLTGRADEVVPSRFFDCKINDRLKNIELDEVVEEVTIVDPKANPEEPERSCERLN